MCMSGAELSVRQSWVVSLGLCSKPLCHCSQAAVGSQLSNLLLKGHNKQLWSCGGQRKVLDVAVAEKGLKEIVRALLDVYCMTVY